MASGSRPILIYDDKISRDVAEGEAEGAREIFESAKILSFSGEQTTDLVYLCGNYDEFVNNEKVTDFILDNVLKVSGKFTLKCASANGDSSAKLVKHLRYSGFVKVELKSDQLITAEKDKREVNCRIVPS